MFQSHLTIVVEIISFIHTHYSGIENEIIAGLSDKNIVS
jgi:hypothetical protein